MEGDTLAGNDMLQLRRRLDLRLAELRLDRSGIEADWMDLTRYLLPKRGRYLVQTGTKRSRATSTKILDPTGTKAHGALASFCMAGITNPSLSWFHLSVGDDDLDDDEDVRSWCNEVQRRMAKVLSSGTFYHALGQVYEEEGGFGTAVMLMLDDFEDVTRFYPLTVGEYYLALDDRQEIDAVYREYSLTVAQMVKQFGLERCSANVQSQYQSNQLSGTTVVVHAIEPNRDRKHGQLGWQSKPWIGVYYERGQNAGVLKVEGFSHKPFVAPRWHALSGDAYGTGPGHEALPDIKSLQAGVRQVREAAEKLINPPLQADARHQNLYVGQLPGDVNWIPGLDNGGANHGGLRPIFTVPPQVEPLIQEVQGYRDTIRSAFFNDLIFAVTQMEGVQPRTQIEIAQRVQEKMLQLGPMLERFYSEALSPIIRCVFARMQTVGLIPPPPQKLRARQIEPKFVSVLALAQKSVGTTSIEQFIRFVGSILGVVPGVAQKIDWDEVVTQYGRAVDIPNKIVRDQKAVDAERAAQAQQQQMAQAADNAQKLAGGAETLSNTDVGGGQNALAAILGRGGGAG